MAWAHRSTILGILALAAIVGLAVAQAPPAKEAPAKEAPAKEAPASEPAAKEPDTLADDQKTLRDVGVAADGPALLDYFRKRTLPTADPQKIQALIRQLGDDDFDRREEASVGLAALGAAATAGLDKAAKENAPDQPKADTEVRKRALDLKQRVEAKAEPAIQAAAARLIARTRPADAADVLLAYVPFAIDASVVDEIGKTLGAVALTDGKAEPALVKALHDSVALKRGVAAEGLIRAGAKEELPAARALLKDAEPQVRLRVAMALLPRREKEAVPVLIDLFADLTPEELWPAEDLLNNLAGDKAPAVSLGTDVATRKAARDAWQTWYTAAKDQLDFAKLEKPRVLLGYTALVHQSVNRVVGGKFRGITYEVMELKADKSVRWKFEVNTQPVDLQVLGENRVLLAEFSGMRITERDFKGQVLWEKQVGGNPIGVQRLPNGNTFVIKTNGVAEYNRKGDEVFSYQHQGQQFGANLIRGKKLRNGEVVFIANAGINAIVTRMDPRTRKVLKTFNVGQVGSLFGTMDALPNGNILVPDWQRQRVAEYNADGKEVKSFNVHLPLGATRLPNGNTLITSQNPGRVIELNRDGHEVWAYQCEGNVFNARRR